MKLISIGDLPHGGVAKSFGYRPWGALIMLAMVLACPAVPVVLVVEKVDIFGGGMPWWGWVLASPIGLVGLVIWVVVLGASWQAVGACFRRSNWVMRVAFEGLYLQFRSYLNHHFPEEGPTVVHLPWGDIAAVQRTVHRTLSVGNRGRSEMKMASYLDLHLTHTDTEPLRQAVAQEAARKPPKKGRTSSRFHHVPVQVPEPGVVRVEWRGRGMIKALQNRVPIRPRRRTGCGCGDSPGGDDVDGQIIDLIEQGRRMAAIRTVRHRYRMSLTEARDFVDDLVQGQAQRAEESSVSEEICAEG